MERMLKLLVSLGEVKNYTMYGRSEPCCPPIILVWYRRVRAGALDEMTLAFDSYHGAFEWSFQATPQVWAVMPKRVPELTAERALNGFLLAGKVLMEEEPTFAALAHRDLEFLAEHVSRCLGKGTSA